MTVGARRRIAMARRNSFAVDAFGDVLGRLLVAATAGLRQLRKMQRRSREPGRYNGMSIMAIATPGGV